MTEAQRQEIAESIAQGVSPRLAEMLVLQQPPGANTDREFLHGDCNGNQFEKSPRVGDHYAAIARRAGVNVKGKKYLSSLARYPGDPAAWVDGKGDAQRVIEQNGWGAQGMINRPVTKVAEPTEVALAENIIEDRILDRMEEAVAAGGTPADVDVQAAREEIIAKHAPAWAK